MLEKNCVTLNISVFHNKKENQTNKEVESDNIEIAYSF